MLGRDGQDRLVRRVRGELGLVRRPGTRAAAARRERRGRVARERIERCLVHEQRGRAVGEQRAQLGRGEPRVDRHRDRADPRGREHELEIGAAVAEQQRHAVARADAARREQRRAAPGALVERAVIEATLGVDDREVIRPDLRAAQRPRADVVQRRGHRAVDSASISTSRETAVNLLGQPAHVGRHCGSNVYEAEKAVVDFYADALGDRHPLQSQYRAAAALPLRVLQVRRRVVPEEPVREPARPPGLVPVRADPARRARAHALDDHRALSPPRPRLGGERDRRDARRRPASCSCAATRIRASCRRSRTRATGGFVVDANTAQKKAPPPPFPTATGPDLAPLTKTVDERRCWMFSGPGKNYHTDREQAEKLGFPTIVVQGMMSTCFVVAADAGPLRRGLAARRAHVGEAHQRALGRRDGERARPDQGRAGRGHAHARALRGVGRQDRRHADPRGRRERGAGVRRGPARSGATRAARGRARRGAARSARAYGARGGVGRARLDRAGRRARGDGASPLGRATRSRSGTCTTGCAARRPTPTRPRSPALAERLGVPFAAERVAPHALREGASSRDRPTLQEAARALRYAALDRHRRAARRASGSPPRTTPTTRPRRCSCACSAAAVPTGSAGSPSARPTAGSCGRCCASRAPISSATRARARSRWREDRLERARPTTRATGCARWLPALARDFNPRLLRAIADLAEAQRRDSRVDPRRGRSGRPTRASPSRGHGCGSTRRTGARCPRRSSRRLAREALVRAGGARHVERGAPRADRAFPGRVARRAGASSCPAVSNSAAIARGSGSDRCRAEFGLRHGANSSAKLR